MIQTAIIRHTLQIRQPNGLWNPCVAGMYSEAIRLCDRGRLVEALESAAATHVDNYGSERGFRVQTAQVTSTTLDRDGSHIIPPEQSPNNEG